MTQHVFKGTATRDMRKRAPLTNGGIGFTTVPDGKETGAVSLLVDVDKILSTLGKRALENKTNRASALHGAIVVLVTERKRER